MAIFRWGANFDPFAGLRYVQRELERLARPWGDQTRRIGGGVFPSVNVYESADEVLIQCEVPGIEQKDLDVTITGETLTIKGTKRPLPDEENINFIRRERGSGQFTRTIILPDAVDADKVEASLSNGIMTIRLPKKAAVKPKQIEIKAN
ncbi:MAG: Hsp20/alpha crystallin family protein [Planctomycetota bacterium]|nr:Hsp20/alpha crystallin family protein [Planctomycetota bacterium]